LGTEFELMQTAVKPYPSCRYGHAGIDAALTLRAEHAIDPATIERVMLGLPEAGMRLIGAPAAQKADPQNVVDGQFSGPFVIAAALATGKMDWDSYALLRDTRIRTLLPRIACEWDSEIQAEFPANMSGKLTVVADGKTLQAVVIVPKGEPGNFLTQDELARKFMALTATVLGKERAGCLADAVLAIDTAPGVSPLLRMASPVMGARLAGD
jgi:2-methylcitrate dehydratase PrpD